MQNFILNLNIYVKNNFLYNLFLESIYFVNLGVEVGGKDEKNE